MTADVLAKSLAGRPDPQQDVDEVVDIPEEEAVQPRGRGVAIYEVSRRRRERSMRMRVNQLSATEPSGLLLPDRGPNVAAVP